MRVTFWSGRRGSNPRPTAWEAVTLPLSYSRFQMACQYYRSGCRRRPFSITIMHNPFMVAFTRVLDAPITGLHMKRFAGHSYNTTDDGETEMHRAGDCSDSLALERF